MTGPAAGRPAGEQPPRVAADPAPNAGRPLTAPAAPGEGRVWRRPTGRGMPAGAPSRPTGELPRGDGTVGRFLAIAAVAVAVFAAGALLGGPLGLAPAPVPTATPAFAAGAAPVAGAFADLLAQAGQLTVALTDGDGEPAGAVVVSTADRRLIVVTRTAIPADEPWVVAFERDGERTPIGTLVSEPDAVSGAPVSWWIGELPDALPTDAFATGDRIVVVPEARTWETPALEAAY